MSKLYVHETPCNKTYHTSSYCIQDSSKLDLLAVLNVYVYDRDRRLPRSRVKGNTGPARSSPSINSPVTMPANEYLPTRVHAGGPRTRALVGFERAAPKHRVLTPAVRARDIIHWLFLQAPAWLLSSGLNQRYLHFKRERFFCG